jgi:hypothetical protein
VIISIARLILVLDKQGPDSQGILSEFRFVRWLALECYEPVTTESRGPLVFYVGQQ